MADGWLLMPLRLFLGGTFVFAGIQKLANPDFLRNSSPSSIHAQLVGASHSSPIHGLVIHLVPIASAVGLLIAVGEVAIGLGALVGLWTRVAAAAGMALSFGLFLCVSFHASPYFTGADIVFFFAWTPFALGGAAGAPALDTWLAREHDQVVPAPRGGVPRRAVLSQGALTGMAAGIVVVGSGLAALIGRLAGGTPAAAGGAPTLSGVGSGSTTPTTATGPGRSTTPTTGSTPAGTAIGPASSVPVGGSATFTDPASGDPGLVIQSTADAFVAFDAICPHAGCTVAYQASANIIACPCHGSTFDARTGAVTNGPAPSGLGKLKVTKGSNGNLYVAK